LQLCVAESNGAPFVMDSATRCTKSTPTLTEFWMSAVTNSMRQATSHSQMAFVTGIANCIPN
jgi:hypothetical protein